MKSLKINSVKIDSNDPFGKDLLGRQKEIINLNPLILNLNTPSVFAINSRWGTGKTTFIRMWSAFLALESIPNIYFNAWATDFSDDPLVAFLGEINEQLKKFIGNKGKKKKAWEGAKKIGLQIAKRGVPALIKAGTAGLVDANEMLEEVLPEIMKGAADDALQVFKKQKDAIQSFKELLKESIHNSKDTKPVVIFIDELDRCRPDYAISLLERIKHLFDIEGLIFILALDREQLGHSVCWT